MVDIIHRLWGNVYDTEEVKEIQKLKTKKQSYKSKVKNMGTSSNLFAYKGQKYFCIFICHFGF